MNETNYIGEVTDDALAGLYRDWLSMWLGGVGADPTAETLARYAREGRCLLRGEWPLPGRAEEFARFARVRLEGKRRGLDLRAAITAYRNGKDFPARPPE